MLRRALRRGAMARRDESGFSLIELLVAASIFLIVSSGLLYGLTQALITTRDARARQVAANLAAQQIDQARLTDDINQVTTVELPPVTVGTDTFTVFVSANWALANSDVSPCDGADGTDFFQYKKVSVRVEWANMSSTTQPVRSDTLIQPHAGTFDPNFGNIAVKVREASGDPNEGVRVVVRDPVTGNTLRNELTDEDGCVFLVELPPGSYEVSLEAENHVDIAGSPTPLETVAVTEGDTTRLQLDYDEQATLRALLPSGNGYGNGGSSSVSYPAPTEVPLWIASTYLEPEGQRMIEGEGAERTISGLFPFSSGYFVWAGRCPSSDPEGVPRDADGNPTGGKFWPGGQRAPAAAVSPGETTDIKVVMGRLEVELDRERGNENDQLIRAVRVGPESGCAESYDLGRTTSNGGLRASLPYGKWRIEAPGLDPEGPWPVVTLDPGSTSVHKVKIEIEDED
jgi:prepilin-type N-terminal cleavage/methylation domain-containing protein